MDRYKEVEDFYREKISELEKIDDLQIKKLVIVSMIDSLAQEFFNYPIGNADAFCDFIIKFAPTKNFLSEVDVVTLYYKNKSLFDSNGLNLDYLEDGYNYTVEQLMLLPETIKIIKYATSNNIKTKMHRYCNLIYKHRSKLTHEFREVGVGFKSLEENCVINYLAYTKFRSKDIYWRINIPYSFLLELFNECLTNYISYCKVNKIDLFNNLKEYFSWYE